MAGLQLDLLPAGVVLTLGASLLVGFRLWLWLSRRRAVRRTRTLLERAPRDTRP